MNQELGHFDLATMIAVVVIPYVARRGDDPQVETALAAADAEPDYLPLDCVTLLR